jgi:hypothetical protein
MFVKDGITDWYPSYINLPRGVAPSNAIWAPKAILNWHNLQRSTINYSWYNRWLLYIYINNIYIYKYIIYIYTYTPSIWLQMLTDLRQWHANGNSSWISEAWAPFQLNEAAWGKKKWLWAYGMGQNFSGPPADLGHFYPILEVLEVQIWLFLVSNIYICIFWVSSI